MFLPVHFFIKSVCTYVICNKGLQEGESLKKNKHTGLFIQELRVSEQNTLCDDKEKKFFFSKKHG